jgi:hypothetical protein
MLELQVIAGPLRTILQPSFSSLAITSLVRLE